MGHQEAVPSFVVPALRKSRSVGHPGSWWCKGGPAASFAQNAKGWCTRRLQSIAKFLERDGERRIQPPVKSVGNFVHFGQMGEYKWLDRA